MQADRAVSQAAAQAAAPAISWTLGPRCWVLGPGSSGPGFWVLGPRSSVLGLGLVPLEVEASDWKDRCDIDAPSKAHLRARLPMRARLSSKALHVSEAPDAGADFEPRAGVALRERLSSKAYPLVGARAEPCWHTCRATSAHVHSPCDVGPMGPRRSDRPHPIASEKNNHP